jgi:hypothetical protein
VADASLYFPMVPGLFKPVSLESDRQQTVLRLPDSQVTASTFAKKVDAWQSRLLQGHMGDRIIHASRPAEEIAQWTQRVPGAQHTLMKLSGAAPSFQELMGFQRNTVDLMAALRHPAQWASTVQQNLAQVPGKVMAGLKQPLRFGAQALNGSFIKPITETLSTGRAPISGALYGLAVLTLPFDSLMAGHKARQEAKEAGLTTEAQQDWGQTVATRRFGKNVASWLAAGVGFNLGQSLLCFTLGGLTWPAVACGIVLGVGASMASRQWLDKLLPEHLPDMPKDTAQLPPSQHLARPSLHQRPIV